MNGISPSIDMLAPIEDRGGAAQPLLQVSGLTKHFPVRGDLFAARLQFSRARRSGSSANPDAASRPPRGC